MYLETPQTNRLRLREAARYLNIPDYTLRRYSERNQVGFYLSNGRRLYEIADLDALKVSRKLGTYVPAKAEGKE